MDQQDNNAFQSHDQPHSSRLTETPSFIDSSSESRPLLDDVNDEIISIQSPENPANSLSEPNPLLNGGWL